MLDVLKPCAFHLDTLRISILSELPERWFSTDEEDASGAETINSINIQEYCENSYAF